MKWLSEVEKQILDIFGEGLSVDTFKTINHLEEFWQKYLGEGLSVDTSKTTAVFDFAAQAGKYWKRGGI